MAVTEKGVRPLKTSFASIWWLFLNSRKSFQRSRAWRAHQICFRWCCWRLVKWTSLFECCKSHSQTWGQVSIFLVDHFTTDHKLFLLLVRWLKELSYALLLNRLPHPSECRLYYVNRDTLFSYHKASEVFLQVTILHAKYYLQMSQWNVANVLPM